MSRTDASPLLSNRCYLPHRTLWFGWALLYSDSVCIQGWTWRGRYRRVLPLERVEQVKWWAVPDDVNLLLRLSDGETVPLHLRKNAGTWNAKLHDLLDQRLMVRRALPEDRIPSGSATGPANAARDEEGPASKE